jgi:AraC-like DNA-binding protein
VKQLAADSCLSIRQFERIFPAFVGLSPKQYLRIARFQKIIQLGNSGHFDNYTSLAYDCGYYDQAHFIHDFRPITDLSPREFFNNKNPHP